MIPDPSGRTQPTKISGLIYLLLGIVAIMCAIFILVVSLRMNSLGNARYFFFAILMFWGGYRIVSGIRTIRAADALDKQQATQQRSGGGRLSSDANIPQS